MNNNMPLYSDHKFLFTKLNMILLLLTAFILPGQSYAHRGASVEFDECRIKVGSEWIHFTAYTPTLTAGKDYCKVIPQLGPTNLVFDYEGKQLRHVTVEFEITKEPEGSRVFYQEPKMIQTGSVNGLVDFSQYGPGEYLAHVTIVHKGEKLDSHLLFEVGGGEPFDASNKFVIAFILFFLVLVVMIYKAKKAPAEMPPVTANTDEPVEQSDEPSAAQDISETEDKK